MVLEHFIYELASPLGTDEIKEKQMKKGMKNLSELLLNSGEDGVSVTEVPCERTQEGQCIYEEDGQNSFHLSPEDGRLSLPRRIC